MVVDGFGNQERKKRKSKDDSRFCCFVESENIAF